MLTLTILKSAWGPWLILPDLVPSWHYTNCGRDKLCLVSCLGSEPRRIETQKRHFSGAYVKPPHLRAGECGPCLDFLSYTLIFALQLRKITENLCQVIRMSLGWEAPNVIRLVDLAMAGDGLDWPAGPCRPSLSCQATGSTLGQCKNLPSCRTRGFPTSANFELKLAVRALMWSANNGTPRF